VVLLDQVIQVFDQALVRPAWEGFQRLSGLQWPWDRPRFYRQLCCFPPLAGGGVLPIESKQIKKAMKQAKWQAFRRDGKHIPLKEGGFSQEENKRASDKNKRPG
jgi:hypothetical protein